MMLSYCLGEPCSVKLVTLILTDPTQHFILWNWYGSTETTVASTFHPVDITATPETIPIGLSFPNYEYIIVDTFLQFVVNGQEGNEYV